MSSYHTYEDEDEERELLGDTDKEDYCLYCENTKNLIEIRGCKQSYVMFCTCCGPCGLVADIVTLIPKCIVNNAKLCMRW